LTALLVVMKGLPLAYSKDMQEDKEQVFDALAALALAVAAVAGMARDLEPDTAAMRKMAGAGYSTATDLADWLVRAAGLPFREAHGVTGQIVAAAEARGVALHKLTLSEMQAIDSRVSEEVYSVLAVDKSVRSRTSLGGTAPKNVRRAARRWLTRLAKESRARSDKDQHELMHDPLNRL
jgi:argininosuccinate lyase